MCVCVCTLKAPKYRKVLLFARQLVPAALFQVINSSPVTSLWRNQTVSLATNMAVASLYSMKQLPVNSRYFDVFRKGLPQRSSNISVSR